MSILERLRPEFEASDGSFLILLRCDLRWDPLAFERLTSAMFELVRGRDPASPIPRWIAEGFWYVDWFVKEWSSHPAFPRPHGEDYYERAYERLHDLAFWLFMGESPYRGGTGFEKLEAPA